MAKEEFFKFLILYKLFGFIVSIYINICEFSITHHKKIVLVIIKLLIVKCLNCRVFKS